MDIGGVKVDRNEARKHFKELGLSYGNINPIDIRKLANMLEAELIEYLKNGGFHAKQMNMQVGKQLKKDINFKDGKLIGASIKIDGSYFKNREGITFNETGFIGFGGEFSDVNVEPILKAFCKWCYTLS